MTTGTGLVGRYYPNAALSGEPALVRTEAPWFDWGAASPGPGVPADNFSVRWTGNVQAVAAGVYRFRTNSDDGVRVYQGGDLIIDNWGPHSVQTNTSSPRNLSAGEVTPVVVEFRELTGDAVLKLWWQQPGGSYEQLPVTQMFATGVTDDEAQAMALSAASLEWITLNGVVLADILVSPADADGTPFQTSLDNFIAWAAPQGGSRPWMSWRNALYPRAEVAVGRVRIRAPGRLSDVTS